MTHPRLISIANSWPSINIDGPADLLDRKTYSLLLSRQARRPGSRDWWLHSVREAAQWAALQEWVAICGGGLMHLDFTRWAAHSFGQAVWIDVDEKRNKSTGPEPPGDKWCDLHITLQSNDMPKRDLPFARDKAVTGLSDVLIAVAAREGGLMEKIGLDAISAGKRVIAFNPPARSKIYAGNRNLLDKGAELLNLPVKIPEIQEHGAAEIIKSRISSELSAEDYLWHFTHECPGPWPGQTWRTYFSELVAGTPGSGHDALDCLMRILSEERIRGFGGMIRGCYPAVCWSGSPPAETMARRRYRSTLVRWEFQPYGIGIRRDVAGKLGLRPAIVRPSGEYLSVPEKDRYLFQAMPEVTPQWTETEEWRSQGDFLLTDLHPSEGAILVKSPDERGLILPISRFPVISL